MTRKVPAPLRRAVAARAKEICEYCRCQYKFSQDSFDIEHITPQAKGGPTILENLALACHGCNSAKSDRVLVWDEINAVSVPLFHPRLHSWGEHFVWSYDFIQILGVTPIGRATVRALQMNRPGLLNQRRVLRLAGEHPPA